MLNKEDLIHIQLALSSITFKAGQKDLYLANEQVLSKITNELKGMQKNECAKKTTS